MRRMGIALAAMSLTLVASTGHAADVLPVHLVGIWATNKSEFHGEALLRGQALYLDTDGVGAIVGGPPPIGVRIVATYDARTNRLSIKINEGGETRTGTFTYEATRKMIVDGGVEYHQQADDISAVTRKALGLEAKAP